MIEFIATSVDIPQAKAVELLAQLREQKEQGADELDFWNDYLDSLGYDFQRKRFWLRQWNRTKSLTIKEIPGMLALVQQLQKQGFRTPLFSNINENWAQSVQKAGYYDHFAPLFLSYQMNAEKPHREAYQQVSEALQLDAQACLFIDDKLENVEAAKKIGMDALDFKSPSQLVEELHQRHIEVQILKEQHV